MNRNPLGVNALVGFEVVFDATHAPGPRRDGAPGIRRTILFSAACACIHRANAVAETRQIVGINISVVEGGNSYAGVEQRLDVDSSKPASRWGRDAGVGLGVPNGLWLNTRIFDSVLHRAEINRKEHRHGLRRARG